MEDCFVWTSQPGQRTGADFSQPSEDNGEFIGLPLHLQVWFRPPLSDESQPPERIYFMMLFDGTNIVPQPNQTPVLFRTLFRSDLMQDRSCIFVNPDQLQSGQ
jgi:hypothetical protein